MKPSFLAVLTALCVCLTGCVGIRYVQTSQNGVKTSVTVIRAFASTDAYKCAISQTNAVLEAYKSGVDGKALGVAAGTALKAAALP